MFLGIEIGGTKLQLGVGQGDGSPLVHLERFTVNRCRGAAGIREEIARCGRELIDRQLAQQDDRRYETLSSHSR